MPHRTPICHRDAASAPHSSRMSPLGDGTQCPPRRLYVPSTEQWIGTTTGRIAPDPYSWMQAVHWVSDLAAKGLYKPSSSKSPKWGPTTVRLAQEIAALKECRPGIAYLMRKLKACARTVKYHLGMLRETGLLAYTAKGTRVRGEGNQASLFERVIPAAFDTAHGIRTIGEGVQRRIVGASAEHRKALGKLAKKAASKVRRPRRKSSRRPSTATSSAGSRCTPMEGGTTGGSSAGGTYSPPESKLASGSQESPTEKSSNSQDRGRKKNRRTLNRVGRRYQLAAELIAQVPWLHNANRDRIAWIVRHVADAGWTALEVQAVAEQDAVTDRGVFRPSGYLAHRISGAHNLYNTPQRRRTAVEAWQDSRRAEQDRHREQDAQQQGPASHGARRMWADALNRLRERTARRAPHLFTIRTDNDLAFDLTDLDRQTVQQSRADAAHDLTVITSAIASGMSENDARRLYTNHLVNQAINAQQTLTPAF